MKDKIRRNSTQTTLLIRSDPMHQDVMKRGNSSPKTWPGRAGIPAAENSLPCSMILFLFFFVTALFRLFSSSAEKKCGGKGDKGMKEFMENDTKGDWNEEQADSVASAS